MDRTIHTQFYPGNIGSYDPYLLYVDVAGGRGGSPGVAGGGDGDGDVPTTLPSGQSPGPSRPGTKYPVRGNPSLRFTTALPLTAGLTFWPGHNIWCFLCGFGVAARDI